MYAPESFNEPDRKVLLDLIDAHGFATLVSCPSGDPVVSHVPLLVDRTGAVGEECLLGHVARANRHGELLDRDAPVLAIFAGPHAYVSPSWYVTELSVPTWNYAVVHAHGRARVVDAATTSSIVARLVAQYEGTKPYRWPGNLPAAFVRAQLDAIVGFRISIDRLEGKFKLGQNRNPIDREGTLAGLEREPDSASRALAAFTRRHLTRRGGVP